MRTNGLFVLFFAFFLSNAYGYPNASKEGLIREDRIRGGSDINISQAKYYVLVICGNVMCGGTLVAQNKVITAGHCVDTCLVRNFRIAVGLSSMSQYAQAKKYGASAINIHPKYNRFYPFPYDVAVVTLSQNVELNENVGTIPYATSVPSVGNYLTVVGYGLLNTYGQRAEKLQTAKLRITDNRRTLILTDGTGPSVLQGDSGGPAVYGNQLAGITSGMNTFLGRIIRNIFVALGNPEIQSFVRQYVQ